MNVWKLPEIVIAPETIFYIGGFPVTNTLLCTWITIVVLVGLFFWGTRRRDMIPTGFLQNFLEWVIEGLLGLVESVAGKEKGKRFFPLVASFFLFIVVANLLDVFPGVDTFGWVKTDEVLKAGGNPNAFFLTGAASNLITPWIRPATTDLNLTLAMAVVSVVVTQGFGFFLLGAGPQLTKYFNFKALAKGPMGLIDVFVGLLEIVSELGRIISFSFRLFGNVFAGGVLLAVFAFLSYGVLNIIFIPLEIFIAFIQALVFSMLTLVFLELGTTSHDHGDHGDHGEGEHATQGQETTATAHS